MLCGRAVVSIVIVLVVHGEAKVSFVLCGWVFLCFVDARTKQRILRPGHAEFPLTRSLLISEWIQPQEISPPPTANLDRSNDKVYENVTGLVKAVIEMSSKIQPAPPEEYVPMVKEVGLALRTLLATVDETIPVLPTSTHREIEMAQKLLNSDLAELINKMKLAQQYVMTSLQQEYKKQMLTAAHALAVDAKNLLDVIDQARLKSIGQSRPH
ncbi:UNVERIFIED_CONTAM: putative serine/threonine protein phosphatase [Gekko kuhli]